MEKKIEGNKGRIGSTTSLAYRCPFRSWSIYVGKSARPVGNVHIINHRAISRQKGKKKRQTNTEIIMQAVGYVIINSLP